MTQTTSFENQSQPVSEVVNGQGGEPEPLRAQEIHVHLDPDLQIIPPRQALILAIGKARIDFDAVVKSKKGMIGARTFEYAPLGVLVEAMESALAKHEIGFVMPLDSDPQAFTASLVVSGHGAEIKSSITLPMPSAADLAETRGQNETAKPLGAKWIQEFGRISTYARRYLINSFFALDAVDDADNEREQDKHPVSRAQKDSQAASPRELERTLRPNTPARPTFVETPTEPVTEDVFEEPRLGDAEVRDALNVEVRALGWDRSMVDKFVRANFQKGLLELTNNEKNEMLRRLKALQTMQEGK